MSALWMIIQPCKYAKTYMTLFSCSDDVFWLMNVFQEKCHKARCHFILSECRGPNACFMALIPIKCVTLIFSQADVLLRQLSFIFRTSLLRESRDLVARLLN